VGLHKQMVRFIIREAKFSPIRGTVLLLGRQTIHLTPDRFSELMREEEMQFDPSIPLTLDSYTRASQGKGFISDTYLFKVLGADKVIAIDVSDYEGAEIVHNLDTPIPAELEGKFDFICNGSVFDNMFNPIVGLTNSSRLLAPRGRVIHFEHASNYTNAAYLQFSPNWFFDYYVVNRFADCKTYLAFFNDLNGPWEFFSCLYSDLSEPEIFDSPRYAMTAVIAEKAIDSTWNQFPVQGQYRNPEQLVQYMAYQQRFTNSVRPSLSPSKKWPSSSTRKGYNALGTYL
jgi:hypothetical protein